MSYKGTTPIKMHLMHKHVVSELKAHWKVLSDYLECPLEVRKDIEENNNGDQRKCFIAVLEEWTTGGTEESPNTWSKFIKVLYEIMEHEEEDKLVNAVSQVLRSLAHAGIQEGQYPRNQTYTCIYCAW